MTTKNKLISGLVLSAILTSGLYAAPEINQKNDERGSSDKLTCTMKKGEGHKMNMQQPEFFGIFSELNLNDEQKTKIKTIMQDSRKNLKNSDEAFTKDSFDKDKYVQIMSEKRDNMLKSEAEVIEKTYAILTTKQKEQLKMLMDLRKEKMNQRIEEKIKG
jgi:Spy/CpxP family protein refolding chaperone